jgi:hypothetical protein
MLVRENPIRCNHPIVSSFSTVALFYLRLVGAMLWFICVAMLRTLIGERKMFTIRYEYRGVVHYFKTESRGSALTLKMLLLHTPGASADIL